MTVSVIVPAYNEESFIGRCLGTLLAESWPGEFEVIVVANGCCDRTVEVALTTDYPVTVLDLPAGNKIEAIRAAEERCRGGARIYLDADVTVTSASLRILASRLEQPGPRVVVPRRVLDLEDGSLFARWYYRVWERLPSVRTEGHGTGCYGLSAEARALFGVFPDVTADDTFARRLLGAGEVEIIDEAESVVTPAATIREIVRRGSRTRRGNAEVVGDHPGTPSRWALFVRESARRPKEWPGFLVLLLTHIAIRLAARTPWRRQSW